MTQNPLYNALAAFLYIVFVIGIMTIASALGGPDEPDTILVPMGMLSLFVLSTAVMAYIFFYQPVSMLLDGKKQEATQLFVRTVAIFAGFTLVVLVGMFLFQQ